MSSRKNRNKGKETYAIIDALLTKRPKGSKGHGGIKRDKKMSIINIQKKKGK